MMNKKQWPLLLALAAALPGVSRAQLVISDTLTGASSSYDWKALNGACLTAGNNTGSIPACSGLSYYSGKTLVGGATGTLPDAVGSGALRLTNGDTSTSGSNGTYQSGAVVSNFTFPSTQGLQVTFTTVTYGGNNYSGTGADGISFFLADGSKSATVGALGGSLGYSCSNVNSTYDGVLGGYIGLGIDEFGNFSNSGDNTSSGTGFKASRISLRGAGSTNWSYLNATYPSYYPSSLSASQQATAVKKTCSTGYLYDFSQGGRSPTQKSALTYNYNYITGDDLSFTIANQEAVSKPLRGSAVPITYGLTITQDGLLSLSYSVNGGTAQPVITSQSITSSNGALPASFRFGFSAGTGGGSNVHEITCFKAAPVEQSSSSAGANVQQSARVEAGTQLYLAYYHPSNWWGELTAQSLVVDSTTGTVSIASTANWDASCTLTGGACQAMGSSATVTATSPASRKILTWNGSAGIPFEWSNLSSTQQSSLTSGDTTVNGNRLAYLRGDRTKEASSSGPYRTRTGVLGDIINSSPTWVGAPSSSYNGPWVDSLNGSASTVEPTGSYATFKSTYATRQNVVYVGANDGMVHGFRAGAYDSSGNFVSNTTTPNDGVETVAYMPGAVLSTIHSTTGKVDFSSPSYSHNLYVDATPGTGDLYYNGAWHTWLVGGLGGGGNAAGTIADNTTSTSGALYALDITDPTQFSESNASSLVIGEWSSSNLTCVNVANCGQYLGNTYGTPVIRRLHNGMWAVLFGNGYNSASGTAGLFVMLVNPSSGAKTFYYFDTGYGAAKDPTGKSGKNGIAYVTPADLDGDHITDYVYAGDLFGNVWRFDLTAATASSWSVASAPLFSTTAGQPISSKVVVASVPDTAGGNPRVVVAFGTGRSLPATLTSAATYAASSQALYGVWDWNMSAWNAKAAATSQYSSLAAPQTVTVSSLQTQTITSQSTASGSTASYRTVSTNKVCWQGASVCSSGNNQYGWTLVLPSTTSGSTTNYEQVIYNPTLAYGMFVVNTTIPAVTQILSCTTTQASGYTMAITIGAGGAGSSSFFGDSNGNFSTYNGGIVSGIGLSGTGTPSFVTTDSGVTMVQQTSDGKGSATAVNPSASATGSRVNWVKLR
ncbi:pilus assembly protein [Ralstonia pseudosolanacearum]|nr:pilus assembly protein PilY [Ralstonia solanacearum]